MSFPKHLSTKLEKLSDEFQYRQLKILSEGIDFYSNDYLGFNRESDSAIPFNTVLKSGASGSRLISGNNLEIEHLEKRIAKFHHAQAALLYPSGYQANIGLYQVIAQRGDTILFDEASHASIRDGIRLSFANAQSFKHNDMDDLRLKISTSNSPIYIVVESLYSMDGDTAPLDELAKICEANSTLLIIDEAHALGVFGPNGEGLVHSDDVLKHCIARIYGFGKAAGCQGAAIVGDELLRDLLINYSRSFIFSTGLSPYLVALIDSAYARLENSSAERFKLHSIINYFNSSFRGQGLLTNEVCESPIMALKAQGNEHVLKYASELEKAGIMVKAIRYPTVPRNQERIRISLHAFNTAEEIDLLLVTARKSF